MDKNLGTNLISIIIVIAGLISYNDMIISIGLFALSGAFTNTLAVYMLFNRVPFLYGSAVVESRFEQIKISIHKLIMEQFFTPEYLEKFLKTEFEKDKEELDFNLLMENIDFSIPFNDVKSSIINSSLGTMLGVLQLQKGLESLKKPFEEKMKETLSELVNSNTFQDTIKNTLCSSTANENIRKELDILVTQRLDELDPKILNSLIEKMIKEHLGWLVIWGGVFGAIIGLVVSILR